MTADRRPTMADLDKRVAELDARFKRATIGEGCWNCGCPAEYVRTSSAAAARAETLAEIRRGVEGLAGTGHRRGDDGEIEHGWSVDRAAVLALLAEDTKS